MKITSSPPTVVPPRWLFLQDRDRRGHRRLGRAGRRRPRATVQAAVDELADYLIGQDPLRIEDLWQVLYRGGFYRGGADADERDRRHRPGAVGHQGQGAGRAGLRAARRPGARPDADLRLDRRRPAGDVARQRRGRSKRGFTAVKMNGSEELQIVDTPAKIDAVVERVGAVRDAVGPDIDIGVDFHGRVHRPMAKVLAKTRAVQAVVRRGAGAAGEQRSADASSPPHRDADRHRRAAVLALGLQARAGRRRVSTSSSPTSSHAGGISEVRKIAAMAEAYDVALAPHCPLGPIALAACLQIDSVSTTPSSRSRASASTTTRAATCSTTSSTRRSSHYARRLRRYPAGAGPRHRGRRASRAERAAIGHRWRNPIWRHRTAASPSGERVQSGKGSALRFDCARRLPAPDPYHRQTPCDVHCLLRVTAVLEQLQEQFEDDLLDFGRASSLSYEASRDAVVRLIVVDP